MARDKDRQCVRDFLSWWDDGAQWQPVPNDIEAPDALLRRVDGSAIVGAEVTSAVVTNLAEAHAVAKRIAAELRVRIADVAPPMQVILSFSEARALELKNRRVRATAVGTLAAMVRAAAPGVTDYHVIEKAALRTAGIEWVRRVMLVPGEERLVGSTGGAHGPNAAFFLQRAIDEKVTDLPKYRANTAAQAGGVAVEGVWLLVSVGVGPGLATSLWTIGAGELDPRDFERVFIVDAHEQKVREAVRLPAPIVHVVTIELPPDDDDAPV